MIIVHERVFSYANETCFAITMHGRKYLKMEGKPINIKCKFICYVLDRFVIPAAVLAGVIAERNE